MEGDLGTVTDLAQYRAAKNAEPPEIRAQREREERAQQEREEQERQYSAALDRSQQLAARAAELIPTEYRLAVANI